MSNSFSIILIEAACRRWEIFRFAIVEASCAVASGQIGLADYTARPHCSIDREDPLVTHYHGEFSFEKAMFDANLQEFAARVGNIVALENGGKLPPDEAYTLIKKLWKELKRSRKGLGIGGPKPEPPPDSQG